jgi:hypothetical protein
MSRPDRDTVPPWPKTFLTPSHDLRIAQANDGRFYVLITASRDAQHETVLLAGAADPDRAMRKAANALADAGATLRRGLRRLRLERRRRDRATATAVTDKVDKPR